MAVQWTGLQQFKEDLRNMPSHLTELASTIVVAHASDAEQRTRNAYPHGPTGNLKKGVRMTVNSSDRGGTIATVKSTAFHAHLFEKGTAVRHTKNGANRGRMPVADQSQQMIPIVVQTRRRMYAALMHMLQSEGFTVTGS